MFTGDLMVADTMPGFGDAYPAAWADVLRRLALEVTGGTVVPGHGGALTSIDVRQRREEMRAMVALGRAVARGRMGEREAVRRSPFTRGPTLTAIQRIRAELA
jgi:glyoxylase-like metal-dependent hydrolase (beta-lactamase superfamily II)